ncbi:MAG: hypothetical protein HXY35_05335 [Chloroflexi bacterium]|nr:hypothetical protein [Chloroflexota bacterium]
MNAFASYLEKLGNNFIVASMVPSLAFVIACLMAFDPGLAILTMFKGMGDTARLIALGVLVFILTVIIGFTLTALNTFLLKMLEGYVIPPPVRFLYNKSHRIHRQKAFNQRRHRDILKSKVRELEKFAGGDSLREAELDELGDRYYKAAADYGLAYPEDQADVMPSRFGNALKAAENYPGERYGFDGVQFWPRLVHVIPIEYKMTIDGVRNELSFLVNMSILSMTFSFCCVLAVFFSMWAVPGAGTSPSVYLDFLWVVFKFLSLAALGFAGGFFFYNASIFSVGSFGLVIRSAFDLFRLDLMKKLGLERPKDSAEEFDKWQNLNELIALGSHSLTFKKLDYRKEE